MAEYYTPTPMSKSSTAWINASTVGSLGAAPDTDSGIGSGVSLSSVLVAVAIGAAAEMLGAVTTLFLIEKFAGKKFAGKK